MFRFQVNWPLQLNPIHPLFCTSDPLYPIWIAKYCCLVTDKIDRLLKEHSIRNNHPPTHCHFNYNYSSEDLITTQSPAGLPSSPCQQKRSRHGAQKYNSASQQSTCDPCKLIHNLILFWVWWINYRVLHNRINWSHWLLLGPWICLGNTLGNFAQE